MPTPAQNLVTQHPNAELSSAQTRNPQIEEHWLELPSGRMRYLQSRIRSAAHPHPWADGIFLFLEIHHPGNRTRCDRLCHRQSRCWTVTRAPRHGLHRACHRRARTAVRGRRWSITDFDLLGTSHGGGVAIMVAALCIDKDKQRHAQSSDSCVKRLILVAPVNPWSPHGKRFAPFVGSAFGSLLFRNTDWQALAFPRLPVAATHCSAMVQRFRPIRSRATASRCLRIMF